MLWPAASFVGLAVTVSRGALIAVAAAAIVSVLAPLLRGDRAVTRRYAGGLLFLAASGALVLSSGAFQARLGSVEGATSTQARTIAQELTLRGAEASGWLGYGPGTADATLGRWAREGYLVENSMLQLLLSLGIPGVLLFAAMVGALAVHAIRLRNTAALAGLVAFVVAITGYNAIESVLPLHVLLGLLFVLALAADGHGTASSSPARRREPESSGADLGTQR
jgi:O-antigen ligase